MSETPWDPPTGRFPVKVGATMLHHLGLGPEPNEDYYAFKYSFRPQSYEMNTSMSLTSDRVAKDRFQLVQQSSVNNEPTVWNGMQQTKNFQCILLYDEETETWTLERLETQLMLSHIKSKNPAKQSATPTASAPTSGTPIAPLPQRRRPAVAADQGFDTENPTNGAAGAGTSTPTARPPRPSAVPTPPAPIPAPSRPAPASNAAASSSRPTPRPRPQAISVAKANARPSPKPPAPESNIISLGTGLTPKATVFAPILLPSAPANIPLPVSAASTPLSQSFAPTRGSGGVDVDADTEEEEEEQEENFDDLEAMMAPSPPSTATPFIPPTHPAFLHQSDDSDDENEEEYGYNPLGANANVVPQRADEEEEEEEQEEFEDFLAEELRDSEGSEMEPVPMPTRAPVIPKPIASIPQRAPPPPVPVPLPPRPIETGGRILSLNRFAGGRSGDTDDEDSSSASE